MEKNWPKHVLIELRAIYDRASITVTRIMLNRYNIFDFHPVWLSVHDFWNLQNTENFSITNGQLTYSI